MVLVVVVVIYRPRVTADTYFSLNICSIYPPFTLLRYLIVFYVLLLLLYFHCFILKIRVCGSSGWCRAASSRCLPSFFRSFVLSFLKKKTNKMFNLGQIFVLNVAYLWFCQNHEVNNKRVGGCVGSGAAAALRGPVGLYKRFYEIIYKIMWSCEDMKLWFCLSSSSVLWSEGLFVCSFHM